MNQLKIKRREELRKTTSSRLQEIHPQSVVHPDCLLPRVCPQVPGVVESPSSKDSVLILPPVRGPKAQQCWSRTGTQMGVAAR